MLSHCTHASTIRYTADTKITNKLESTERWEIPREPSEDGGQSYTGDCEDLRARNLPTSARNRPTRLGQVEQYATRVDGRRVEYVCADHRTRGRSHLLPTRNTSRMKPSTATTSGARSIRDTLGPQTWKSRRDSKTCSNKACAACTTSGPNTRANRFYRFFTSKAPATFCPSCFRAFQKTVAKLQEAKWALENTHPELKRMTSTDMSMQLHRASVFYKFAVACMTDVFSECGWLDYTYVSDTKYGAPMAQWVLGEARMRPSASHSHDTMDNIRKIITVERPIRPLLTTSLCLQAPRPFKRFVRYGQKTPIEKIHTNRDTQLATYKIHDCTWYEIYFKV